MVLCRNDATKIICYKSRWYQEPDNPRGGDSVQDAPAGGNEEHIKYIQQKASTWTDRMTNGHLPHHMAWIAYRLQLWPGLRYGLGTMTNDIATSVNSKIDYRMLNILGVARTVTIGLQMLHTIFGGFGLLSVATEQLICRINMLLQHYHTSTNLSRKLEASLRYFQLQLGTPHNPITLDYDKWGHLAPLSWVKKVWRSLHHFIIHLYMECATIPSPRERDQVGCNGTDNWKSSRQQDDTEFEQMPRVIRNNIPIRHDNSRWSISGAVRIQSRQPSSAVQVQVSLRITVKERLGRLVQLLARLYSHQGQTSHPSGSMANSNPQEMDMVL
jgi:hypothetical protein